MTLRPPAVLGFAFLALPCLFAACGGEAFSSGDASPDDDAAEAGPRADAAMTEAAPGHDGGVAPFPDAGSAVAACESCLQSSCAAPVAACQADPACSATIACVVASGCLKPDASSSPTGCVEVCTRNEGLTPKQTAAVVGETAAIEACDAPCAAMCGGT